MAELLPDLLRATIALLVITDPVGLIPAFISTTKDMRSEQRARTLRIAMYVGAALLIAFALAGQLLLILFSISVYSLMIGGGILLLVLSMQLLLKGEWMERRSDGEIAGAVPLGFPLMVGPGAITTTIVNIQTTGLLVGLISVVIVMTITWLVLRSVERIHRLLGTTGSDILSRVMAVFITAIAAQYIILGVQFYYPPSVPGQ